MSSIITLTTDLGEKDFTVSAVKGSIHSLIDNPKIVDVSHRVPKFDIMQAAFILRNAYPFFPKNTVHIVGVMPYETEQNRHVAILYKGHYFVGTDNGVFSMIFNEPAEKIIELDLKVSLHDNGFLKPITDIFVQAACHLAKGGTIQMLGQPKNSLVERTFFKPLIDQNSIRGTIIYIDNFGNAVTNIDELTFKEVRRTRDFTISFRVPGYDIHQISKSYADVSPSEKLAVFGPTGFLEIAINLGNASDLLGLNISDVVTIHFQGA